MEKQIVQEYLNGTSSNELARKYNFKTGKSILDKVKKYGYKPRDATEAMMVNKEYANFSMEFIDNEFKAYFLGLLLSDGHAIKRYNKNKITPGHYVGLSMTDLDAIEFISSTLGKKYNIIKRKHPRQTIYRIIINGKKFFDEVARYGVVERKSRILKKIFLNKNENKYLPYIIRGIIDGDGWIREDGREFFISSASKEFIEWLKDVLENKLYMVYLNIIHNKENDVWYLRSSFEKNINILKTLVYDKRFGMQRKYNKLYGKSSETIMETLNN